MRLGNARAGAVTRWAVRLTLAYALLLQAVLGAAAGTVHALSDADGIAGVLCAPSGRGDAGTGDAAHDPLCCTLGCMAAQPAPGLDGKAGIILPPPPDAGAAILTTTPGDAQAGGTVFSFEARGPPARA